MTPDVQIMVTLTGKANVVMADIAKMTCKTSNRSAVVTILKPSSEPTRYPDQYHLPRIAGGSAMHATRLLTMLIDQKLVAPESALLAEQAIEACRAFTACGSVGP